jgi:hypothetical protein
MSEPAVQPAVVANAASTGPQTCDATGISGSVAPGATTASTMFNVM